VAGDKLMCNGSEIGNLVVRKVLAVMDASFWAKHVFHVEIHGHWIEVCGGSIMSHHV